MKLLHTSDWHLGVTEKGLDAIADQKFFIDAIGDIAAAQNVDVVMIAGDVFDHSVASAQAVWLYDYAMTKLCKELKKPVLIIAGNHDSAERLSVCRELLEEVGLHVCGEVTKQPCVVSFDDTDVYLLPWLTEEVVRSLYPEKKEEITDLTAAYRIVTDAMRADFKPGKKHILLSHSFAENSEVSDSDHAAVVGFAAQISVSVFDGFDYVALGHIHKPQDVGERARYSGTPMPYSFGTEEKQEKSVTIIDTKDMSRTIVPVPLLHKRTSLTGTLEELMHGTFDEDVIDGYVKFTLTDVYAGLSAVSQLTERFPHVLEVTGKSYEAETSTVTLTPEDFQKMENNPLEVFQSFWREEMQGEPDERLTELFRTAVQEAMMSKEEEE